MFIGTHSLTHLIVNTSTGEKGWIHKETDQSGKNSIKDSLNELET